MELHTKLAKLLLCASAKSFNEAFFQILHKIPIINISEIRDRIVIKFWNLIKKVAYFGIAHKKLAKLLLCASAKSFNETFFQILHKISRGFVRL